jgi:hypothetical protein
MFLMDSNLTANGVTNVTHSEPLLIAVMFLLVVAFLHIIHTWMAYHTRTRYIDLVISKSGPHLSRSELEWISFEIGKPITGIKGYTRGLLALSIILLLGCSLFYLIGSDEEMSLVKEILTILSGTVSALVGFYFGGRASEEGAAEKIPQRNDNNGDE